jgi:hypothetical protein
MQQIPFQIQVQGKEVLGFLNVVNGAGRDNDSLPSLFHVMERRNHQNFYVGQLLLNPFKGWWLPDSPYSEYAEWLGNKVELYYE